MVSFGTLVNRVQSAGRAKLLWGSAVGLLCSVTYQTIQLHPLRPASLRRACWTWERLPFATAWTWPYLSMFGLVGLAWLLLPDARAVRRFAGTLVAVAAVGWLCFLAWPTGCARPAVAAAPLAYRWLIVLDQPTNCFPCLHSALSLVAAVTLMRLARSALATALLGAWLVVIVISIVALRQHTDIDTACGLVLGGAGAWIGKTGEVRPG